MTVENDDTIFTPADLLPVCQTTGIPLVYDAHHHRCHPDDLSVEQATEAALATWNREPMFHLSSPIEGWDGPKPERHHDFIDVRDFPDCWRNLRITVEVEAKAKEAAALKLKLELDQRPREKRNASSADRPIGSATTTTLKQKADLATRCHSPPFWRQTIFHPGVETISPTHVARPMGCFSRYYNSRVLMI